MDLDYQTWARKAQRAIEMGHNDEASQYATLALAAATHSLAEETRNLRKVNLDLTKAINRK